MVNTSPPMNKRIQTKQRSEYTGSRSYSDYPLIGFGGQANTPSADASSAWTFPIRSSSLRTMFEEVSVDKDGNTRNQWNDFQHYKMLTPFPQTPYTYGTGWTFSHPTKGYEFPSSDPAMCWPSNSGFGSIDSPTVGLPILYQKNAITGDFIVEVEGIDTLVNTAVRTMLAAVRPEVSLLNSLLELKDFRKLPDTITRVRLTLDLLRRRIPRLLNPRFLGVNSRNTLMVILGAASDVFLQQEFNIKPLISDVGGIRQSLNDLQRRLLQRMHDEGERKRRDFSSPLPGFKDSFESSGLKDHPWTTSSGPITPKRVFGQSEVDRRVAYHSSKFHAQIEYSQYWSEYQRQHALALALLDKLGVFFNPSIIWNAIPWSFAIDWVIDVNRWLKQFGMTNTEPVTIVHKFCWSQTIVRTINCVLYAQKSSWPTFKGPTRTACFVTESAYKRSTSKLNVIASLSGTGINPKEFVLSSALVLSRKGKFK